MPNLKDNVEAALAHARAAERWLSGEELAQQLGVSRAAVWKAITALRESGIEIEAQRNRGYRLAPTQDHLTEQGIFESLSPGAKAAAQVEVLQCTGSTNDDVRSKAIEGAPEFTIVVAGEQQQGRGRRGRPFYSLGDVGIYLSILVKPSFDLHESAKITAAAAVAVCAAIQQVTGEYAQIKWVNDVYYRNRKVCGILTEGVADLESGGLAWAIVGIGINVYPPIAGYPAEYANRAGALLEGIQPGIRDKIAGAVISSFIEAYGQLDSAWLVETYREKSFVPGRDIWVRRGSDPEKPATAVRINDDLSLRVRFDDSTEADINSGEVSIRVE